MTYPVNEQEFIAHWLNVLDEPDDGDREFAKAIARIVNKAYYAGLEDGREEAATCKR